jgi:pyruvate dehydrogenase E2 component (dihydrolipoamide acetyltransferase)
MLMAEPIKLTTEGTLLNWLKDVGDSVSAGEVIAEIEADKATVEIEAPSDGVIVEIKAQPGDELSEGDVIGTIGAEGEASAASDNGKAPAEAEAEDEDTAEDSEDEAEDETEDEAEEEEAPPKEKQAPQSGDNGTAASVTEEGRVRASPVARNMAKERGIDLRQVKGSGPDGRIVKKDIEEFKPDKAAAKEERAAAGPPAQATYGSIPQEDVEVIDIKRMRRRIADGTILSKQQVPHFYITMEVDVEPLLALRKELNASLEDEGIRISVNDLIMKASALALKRFPNLNTHYYGDKLVRHKRINIGVSVALPDNGLVNVVSPDVDKTALSVLAERNKALYERAREGRVKPEDMRGATFTISNLGPWDVEHFAAIIAPPEAAILAVGAAQRVPIVQEDGTLSVGTRMKVTLSVDHRVSDGAEGAEYLKELKALLENPMRLVV